MRALHSGMDVKAYAENVGRARKSVSNEVLAARVADAVAIDGHDLSSVVTHLMEIHAAPRWLWPALVPADGLDAPIGTAFGEVASHGHPGLFLA